VSGFSREGHELIRRVATNVLQLAPALADSMALLLHEQLPDLGAVTDQRAISETRRSCAENIRELLIMFRAGIPARTVSELKRFATAAAPALGRLAPFARVASAFVPALEALLRPARPVVTYLAPYTRELGSFFALDAASLQASDSTGRIILPISGRTWPACSRRRRRRSSAGSKARSTRTARTLTRPPAASPQTSPRPGATRA
jgi:hypothetical protein